MKSNLLVLTVLSLGLSVAGATSAPEKLQSSYPHEMEAYSVYADSVKALDILIDYKQVEVDCKGLGVRYSQVQNKSTAEIFVSKQALAHTMSLCPPLSIKHKIQSGLKISLQAAKGSNYIYRTVVVPKGTVVEIVKHEADDVEEAEEFVCKTSVNCMPPVGLNSVYCSSKYMDWAKDNCQTMPIQLQ